MFLQKILSFQNTPTMLSHFSIHHPSINHEKLTNMFNRTVPRMYALPDCSKTEPEAYRLEAREIGFPSMFGVVSNNNNQAHMIIS